MTVQELITELRKFPKTQKVCVSEVPHYARIHTPTFVGEVPEPNNEDNNADHWQKIVLIK